MKTAVLLGLGIPAVIVGALCSTLVVSTILAGDDGKAIASLEGSTLVQKCNILQEAYKKGNYVDIFETSLAIKEEHTSSPKMSSMQVCSRVGDYKWVDGSQSGTSGVVKIPIR